MDLSDLLDLSEKKERKDNLLSYEESNRLFELNKEIKERGLVEYDNVYEAYTRFKHEVQSKYVSNSPYEKWLGNFVISGKFCPIYDIRFHIQFKKISHLDEIKPIFEEYEKIYTNSLNKDNIDKMFASQEISITYKVSGPNYPTFSVLLKNIENKISKNETSQYYSKVEMNMRTGVYLPIITKDIDLILWVLTYVRYFEGNLNDYVITYYQEPVKSIPNILREDLRMAHLTTDSKSYLNNIIDYISIICNNIYDNNQSNKYNFIFTNDSIDNIRTYVMGLDRSLQFKFSRLEERLDKKHQDSIQHNLDDYITKSDFHSFRDEMKYKLSELSLKDKSHETNILHNRENNTASKKTRKYLMNKTEELETKLVEMESNYESHINKLTSIIKEQNKKIDSLSQSINTLSLEMNHNNHHTYGTEDIESTKSTNSTKSTDSTKSTYNPFDKY